MIKYFITIAKKDMEEEQNTKDMRCYFHFRIVTIISLPHKSISLYA